MRTLKEILELEGAKKIMRGHPINYDGYEGIYVSYDTEAARNNRTLLFE